MNKNEKKPNRVNPFSTAATYFLPYLTPTELSAISQTCKTLNLITKSITAVRSSDASRTFENHPIPFINSVDNHPYTYFTYTPSQILSFPENPTRQPWGLTRPDPVVDVDYTVESLPENTTRQLWVPGRPDLKLDPGVVVGFSGGCVCGKCDDGCGCLREKVDGLVWECGSGCGCGLECGNRVSQRGVSKWLKVVRSGEKGWGLYADEFIESGEFVCEYAGELITTKEARKRQLIYDKLASSNKHTSALLVVREHLPSGNACMRINIDATRIGNVARFINHSCDGGNLSTILVRSTGDLLPRVCFFASRDILKDEELTFSYGEAGLNPNGSKCFCGSDCCSGIMPSENT